MQLVRRSPRSGLVSSSVCLAMLALAGCENPPAEPPEQTVEVLEPITLTTRARTPENDGTLVSVDVSPDQLVFHYSSAPAEPLEVSNVVAGVQGGGYLRAITAIRAIDATTYEATTTHAHLVDYIASGHFHVHHSPRTASWQTTGDVAVDALEGEVSLLPIGLNDACELSSGGSVDVTPILSLNVDFDIDIDIDVDTMLWPPGISGRLVSSDFVMTGSLEVGAEVEAATSGDVTCELDLIEYARDHGIRVPSHEWTTTFVVGVVPVIITHEVGPTASVEVGGSVQTSGVTARSSSTFAIRAGAQYRDDGRGWREVWEPNRSGSGSLTVAEPGDVTIHAGVSAGVEYEAKIYDVVGPHIGLEGSLEGEFTANLCEWNGEATAGISIVGGASIEIPVIDQTLVEFTVTQELASTTIWEDEGTWSRCVDAGMDAATVDEPDGGVDPGEDGSVSGDDGSAPPSCGTLNCTECVAAAGCAFCPGDLTCYDADAAGSCSGGTTTEAGACNECHDLRGTCTDRFECCNATDNPSIECVSGFCEDTSVCLAVDAACTEGVGARCCGLGTCSPAIGGSWECCYAPGSACASTSDCCGHEQCVGGLCQAQAVGQPCENTPECAGSSYCLDTHVCGF
jgi:hypothetical protein